MLEAFERSFEIGAEHRAALDRAFAHGQQQASITLDGFVVDTVAMLGRRVFLVEVFLEGNQRSFSRICVPRRVPD